MIQATLTDSYSWRGIIYEPGDRSIPDDLAAAIGIKPKPGRAKAKTSTQEATVENQNSLTLINQATEAGNLIPLPGIGKGAAERLLLHRPESGYESLVQVQEFCPELSKSPYRVDWEAIALWQPETGEPE